MKTKSQGPSQNHLTIVTLATIFPTAGDPSHGVFIYQRTAHLARQPGVQLVVVAPQPYVPRWLGGQRWAKYQQVPGEETIGHLRVFHPRYFHLPKIWMPFHGFFMFLGCISMLKQLRNQEPIGVIDSHFVYPEGFAAVLLGKMFRTKVVVSARGTDINVYPSLALIRPMIRWTLQKADAVVAVSEALKKRMVSLGIQAEKIKLIPNGIDAHRFQPGDRNVARRYLSLPENGRMIVSVGALISGKGHAIVIRAIAQLAREMPDLRFYVLGDGPVRAELQSLIDQIGLCERVRLVGKRPNEELGHWFAAADVSCLASEREGWPNAVTESLACGTPVVATRVGGIPEIISSEELGILTERSVEGFEAGLRAAFTRIWDRTTIAAHVRNRTWDVVAGEIKALLESKFN